MSPSAISKSLLQSLSSGPLLVGDLPEAHSFPIDDFVIPDDTPPLNLQQKLGHLYEDALAALLENSPRWDLLERNLQIQSDIHTTLGELDFLVRDLESGHLIHLELATKFYLAVESESEILLPGPDARDNYHRKLSRLRSHQLQLPKIHQAHLPEKYRNAPIITRHLIYGCLFDHYGSDNEATPEYLNPGCRRGKWLTVSEIPKFFPAETIFEVVPKSLWPVPFLILKDLPLEPWEPEDKIERCLMVRAQDYGHPIFIAPAWYPDLSP